MKSIRHLAALPLVLIALLLWAVADRLAWISDKIGKGAARVMGA
jgi:hypothetical protein